MKSSERIAVASKSFSKNPFLRAELLNQYSNVVFNDEGKSLKNNELVNFLKDSDKAIVALESIEDDLLAQLPKLKLISKYGVGLDNINMNSLLKRGILLSWTGGVNRRAVAELALSFFLITLRKTFYANQVIKDNNWHQVQGTNLSSKTIGLIGLGHVAQDLVRLLHPFQVKILANDIIDKSLFAKEHGIELVSMEKILRDSDIISLHAPLTTATKNMIKLDSFKLMKKNAVLINTARGGLVDESDLLTALNENLISAAAFDVFLEEPLVNQPLINHPNFLATPHIGGSSTEAILEMGKAAILGLKQGKKALYENFFDYPMESK